MSIYIANLTFGSFRFEADLSQASSPIRSMPDRDDVESDGTCTPYQTADAAHDADNAALLLLEYYGSEYWLDPDVEVLPDETGSEYNGTYDGMNRDAYLRSLLVSVDEEENENRADT